MVVLRVERLLTSSPDARVISKAMVNLPIKAFLALKYLNFKGHIECIIGISDDEQHDQKEVACLWRRVDWRIVG